MAPFFSLAHFSCVPLLFLFLFPHVCWSVRRREVGLEPIVSRSEERKGGSAKGLMFVPHVSDCLLQGNIGRHGNAFKCFLFLFTFSERTKETKSFLKDFRDTDRQIGGHSTAPCLSWCRKPGQIEKTHIAAATCPFFMILPVRSFYVHMYLFPHRHTRRCERSHWRTSSCSNGAIEPRAHDS